MAHILFILGATDTLQPTNGVSTTTGFCPQEFVPAHHLFLEHGHQISVASNKGKPVVPDERCFSPDLHNHDTGRILNLREQLDEIETWRKPLSLERLALSSTKYDAVFFPGGYVPMPDLASSEAAGNLVKRTLSNRGLIGAVCHGAAGLIPAQHEGRWLFFDYRLTCCNPAEAALAESKPAKYLSYPLAENLAKLGGKLSFDTPGTEHIVIDRQLYTGQNWASVEKLAYAMARQLKKKTALDKNACNTPCD